MPAGLATQEADHKWFETHYCGAELLICTSPIIILIRVVFFKPGLCPLGLGAHIVSGT